MVDEYDLTSADAVPRRPDREVVTGYLVGTCVVYEYELPGEKGTRTSTIALGRMFNNTDQLCILLVANPAVGTDSRPGEKRLDDRKSAKAIGKTAGSGRKGCGPLSGRRRDCNSLI